MKLRNRNKATRLIDLPLLAALVVIFVGLGTQTPLDAAPAAIPMRSIASLTAAPATVIDTAAAPATNITVLSPRDAGLYRAAFAAQENSQWTAADEAMSRIKDKKLFGHILADRYLRRAATLAEVKNWMAQYADQSEATTLYNAARHLAGFAAASIAQPIAASTTHGGGFNSGMPLGFHAQAENATGVRNKIAAALHHGNNGAARAFLDDQTRRGNVPQPERMMMTARIAAAYYYQGENDQARKMAHDAASAGVPLGLWIDGLAAWKQRDYTFADRSFASLAQAPGLSSWDKAAAAYWAYRAAKHTGDKVQAQHWLLEAAKYPRSFYGYIAANQIGARASSWQMPDLNAHNTALLAQYPAGWQALALAQIGKTELAERELRRLNPQSNRDLQNAALALAEKAHMPTLSLQLGGVATNDKGQPYEAAAYPLLPWQPTGGFTVDRALVYALIKHESQFNPGAVSPRGACGLMQLMPATASRIDDANNYRNCTDHLADPATNMDLGQRYVRLLAGQPQIGDNLMLLLAAYNGGPGNLAHWLDGEDRSDPLLFMESLPVRETRDYVQQVLLQYWMYRSRLAEPETSVAQIARGEWPRYALTTGAIRQAATTPLTVASR